MWSRRSSHSVGFKAGGGHPRPTYDDTGVLMVIGEEEMERIFTLIDGAGVDLRFLG
jgi:hypothetical protein